MRGKLVRKALLSALCLPGCLLLPLAALAQSSLSAISFQGALNGTSGQPLPNGNYTLTFQFWAHPASTAASNRVGSAVTVPGVAVNGGVASTAIPVQPGWFDGQTRYLGIAVAGFNGGQELTPRVLVTAVPYALMTRGLPVDPSGRLAIARPNGNPIVPGSGNLWLEGGSEDGVLLVGVNSKGPFLQSHASKPISLNPVGNSVGIGIDSPVTNATLHVQRRNRPGNPGVAGEGNIWIDGDAGIASLLLGVETGSAFIQSHASSTLALNPSGNNVGIGTRSPQARLDVNGTTRTTVLQITSDREAKRDFAPADPQAILAKLAELPVSSWAYTNAPSVRHLGPVAQDFHAAFGLGDSDKHIATIDADGVTIAAIQGLHKLVQEQAAENAMLRRRLEVLRESTEQRLLALEARERTGALVPAAASESSQTGVNPH